MEKQDKKFFISFIFTLTLLVFLLKGSITGLVVQTSYCDEEGCYDFCKTSSECIFGETCCQQGDFGICKTECEEEFSYNPDIDKEIPPRIEQPDQIKNNNILYFFLIFFTLVIGASYFFFRNKQIHIKY